MDNGAAVLNVLISIGLIQGLRRFLELKTRFPAWDSRLYQLRIPLFIALGVYLSFHVRLSENWLWAILSVAIGYTLWLSWAYRPARTLLWAGVPMVIVHTLEDATHALFPGFFRANQEFFSSGVGFSVLWLIGFGLVARQQKKNLVREQLERHAQLVRQQQVEAENAQLEQQVAIRTAELTRQKEELLQTVADLRATQEQLVQKEKMASLGELTAGIAHEIQNPLNFVNNFAQVSAELIDELGDELRAGHTDDVQDLMSDIRQNLEKINHHGSRADAIVKAMLQHSRSSTGERQPTDINALCDEYLRLSYHGLRARDNTFNATMETHFDPAVGQVAVVGQDISRVLLNLFNNAFYAVQEKKNQLKALGQLADFEPTIVVSTKKAGDQIEVCVRDNGSGIPESVQSKIFQPFFTTKPTGEGTGLGLSLSYDIITKGHGGTLTVDTREGEFTEFVVTLPA